MNESGSGTGKRDDKSCCACPFCDTPIEKVYPFCKDCGKELSHCSKCGKPIPPNQQVCPDCK